MTATGDIDILLDDRNRMRLIADTKEALGITRLIQEKVDKTFRPHGPNGYRLTNDSGYMVEFIRPLPRPFSRQMPGAAPLENDDITAVPLDGLQWLVNAPEVDTIVIDARGFPAPLICPDPRHFAAHKLWVASLPDREAGKAMRDRLQASAVIDLMLQKLPQFPLDDAFIANLPAAIGALLLDALKSRDAPPAKGAPTGRCLCRPATINAAPPGPTLKEEPLRALRSQLAVDQCRGDMFYLLNKAHKNFP